MNAIEASYVEALSRSTTVDQILELFQSYTTPHAGTLPASLKRRTIRVLKSSFGTQQDQLWDTALRLVASGDPTGEEVGAVLLADLYRHDPPIVTRELKRLADSPHWEVREWVASALGEIVRLHFDSVHPTIREWVTDESENVRRAVVLAAMYASQVDSPMVINTLLDLVTPLLWDHSRYVRDNLGPFALGDGLARRCPDALLARMARWIDEDDMHVRWNLVMIFSTKAGAGLADKAQPILKVLAQDTRPEVQRAWKKAQKNLQRRIDGWSLTQSPG